jgi:tetratricopeptide (TPR) repeat protein
LRCFDNAISDLERAAELIKGKPDEIEPDGLPNSRNVPTSTLQSNIWYHLGLAYYLKGDLTNALRAYEEAQKVSTNPDMRVATTHWHYMTLRRLSRHADAERLLQPLAGPLDIIENQDYYKLIRLYRGELTDGDLLAELRKGSNDLSSASLGYGLGNWYLYNGRRENAMEIFRQITAGDQWASFGYIAAERELRR